MSPKLHYTTIKQQAVLDPHLANSYLAELGCHAGVDDEFINVGRLDNLGMSFCALTALLDTFASPDSLQGESAVKAVALFDHEEVGSSSAQGTQS